jgi:hypothetical protein
MKLKKTLLPTALAALLGSTFAATAANTDNSAATAIGLTTFSVGGVSVTANTVSFNQASPTIVGTLTARTISQTGTLNYASIKVDGAFGDMKIDQNGKNNQVALSTAATGASATNFVYDLDVDGERNLVATDLFGAVTSLKYSLKIASTDTSGGANNLVKETIANASGAVDYKNVITGNFNQIENAIDSSAVDLDLAFTGDSNKWELDANNTALTSLTVKSAITGSSNAIYNVTTGAVTNNTFDIAASGSDIYVSQSAASSILDLTVGKTSSVANLNLDIVQSGTTNQLTLGLEAGAGASYNIVQAAANSVVDDTVTLALGGSSSITIN